MRITNESDYALRILYELSRPDSKADHGDVFSASVLSERTDVTLRFALKILRKLSLAGIVKSKKGAAGGYYLAREPEHLSFGDVIETIEGKICLSNCTNGDYTCPRAIDSDAPCKLHNIFCNLTENFRRELYSIKFSDILSDKKYIPDI